MDDVVPIRANSATLTTWSAIWCSALSVLVQRFVRVPLEVSVDIPRMAHERNVSLFAVSRVVVE